MTPAEITEGSRLIATFIGYTADPYFSDYYMKSTNAFSLKEGDPIVQCQFHTSYDWLIPVCNETFKAVDKLDMNFPPNEQGFILANKIASALLDGKDITEIFEAVVEFIKWYNALQNREA